MILESSQRGSSKDSFSDLRTTFSSRVWVLESGNSNPVNSISMLKPPNQTLQLLLRLVSATLQPSLSSFFFQLQKASQWGGRLVTVTVCLRTDGDFNSDELNMEQEEDDFDDEHDGEEEEEDGREEGEEENGIEKNDNKDAETEELEKECMNLRHQDQDTLKNLKRHKDKDLLKGQAVKNQKALWDKALEFRFLLQKVFSNSNRLPQEPVRSLFCDSHQVVSTAYSDLVDSSKRTLDSLAELQESESSKIIDSDGDEDWSQISQLLSRIPTFRDKSINKWQRKTEVTTGAAAIKSKLHAFNQNVSEQVASYMRDPSRVVRQMQMRKSVVSVFGTVPEEKNTAKGEETKSKAGAQADGDPELLDDSEFYQQLLKEFFETIDPASSETALYSLKKLHTKKRKIVDRRASKSRKIRYNVHKKIVNFMAPETMAIPPMLPDLNNLFGLKKQKPASVV